MSIMHVTDIISGLVYQKVDKKLQMYEYGSQSQRNSLFLASLTACFWQVFTHRIGLLGHRKFLFH